MSTKRHQLPSIEDAKRILYTVNRSSTIERLRAAHVIRMSNGK